MTNALKLPKAIEDMINRFLLGAENRHNLRVAIAQHLDDAYEQGWSRGAGSDKNEYAPAEGEYEPRGASESVCE